MNAIDFPEKTGTAGGEGYVDLPFHAAQLPSGSPVFLTCWQPTEADLAALNAGGVVWVWQLYAPDELGHVIPMSVETYNPFNPQPDGLK